MLATGLGSNSSIASIIRFLSDVVISGFTNDTIKFALKKGNGGYVKKVIKGIIMLLGLDCCGDMV